MVFLYILSISAQVTHHHFYDIFIMFDNFMTFISWLPPCKASKASRIWKLWRVLILRHFMPSSNRNCFIVDLVNPVDPMDKEIILCNNCCDHFISVSYSMIWLLKLLHIFYPTELIKESIRHFWIFHITSRFFSLDPRWPLYFS